MASAAGRGLAAIRSSAASSAERRGGTLRAMSVAERFAIASVRSPLAQLSQAARAELGVILAGVDTFEDLPGKWQAALLEAEAPPGPAAAPVIGSCCSARRAAA